MNRDTDTDGQQRQYQPRRTTSYDSIADPDYYFNSIPPPQVSPVPSASFSLLLQDMDSVLFSTRTVTRFSHPQSRPISLDYRHRSAVSDVIELRGSNASSIVSRSVDTPTSTPIRSLPVHSFPTPPIRLVSPSSPIVSISPTIYNRDSRYSFVTSASPSIAAHRRTSSLVTTKNRPRHPPPPPLPPPRSSPIISHAPSLSAIQDQMDQNRRNKWEEEVRDRRRAAEREEAQARLESRESLMSHDSPMMRSMWSSVAGSETSHDVSWNRINYETTRKDRNDETMRNIDRSYSHYHQRASSSENLHKKGAIKLEPSFDFATLEVDQPQRKLSRRCIFVSLAVFVALLVSGIAIGLILGLEKHPCVGNQCQLSTTCTRLTSTNGSDVFLAKGLVDIALNSTALFSPFLESTRLALVLNSYLGLPVATNTSCAFQLDLVGPLSNLPIATYPRRLAFARAAILYDITLSESSSPLLPFITSLDFSHLSDAPTLISNATFVIVSNGYGFDFSKLTTFIPPLTLSPPPLVSTQDIRALNRIESFATAASTQRDQALQHYWNELNQTADDLSRFITAVQSAAIFVPTTPALPVSLACSYNLTATEKNRLINFESIVFDLSTVTTNCSDRPVYGTIDLLNLNSRGSEGGVGGTATTKMVRLVEAIKTRTTLHAGTTSSSSTSSTLSSPLLPDRFGTYTALNHVVWNYLTLMSRDEAKRVIQSVLTNMTWTEEDALVPVLQVQIFGGVRSEDTIGLN